MAVKSTALTNTVSADLTPAKTPVPTPTPQLDLPDPYITFGGTTMRFLSNCAGQTNCITSAMPIQSAIDFVSAHISQIPITDRTIHVLGGKFNENVLIQSVDSLALQGSQDGSASVINGSVTIANATGIQLNQFQIKGDFKIDTSTNVVVSNITINAVNVSKSDTVSIQNVTANNNVQINNSHNVAVKDASMQALAIASSQSVSVDNAKIEKNAQVDDSRDVSIRNSAIGSVPGQPSLSIIQSENVAVQNVTLSDWIQIDGSRNVLLDTVTVSHSTRDAALVVSNSDQVLVRGFAEPMAFVNSADVQILGTDLSDHLDLTLADVRNLTIDTGAGSDSLSIRGTVNNLVVYSGRTIADALVLQGDSRVIDPGGQVTFIGEGALVLAAGSLIDVSGVGAMNGGVVNVWAQVMVQVLGTILALGGARGKGGTIDIAAGKFAFESRMHTIAPPGNLTWNNLVSIIRNEWTSSILVDAPPASASFTSSSFSSFDLFFGSVVLESTSLLNVSSDLLVGTIRLTSDNGTYFGGTILAHGNRSSVEPVAPFDPYLTYNGLTYRFLSDCTGQANCALSATPIQAALDFAATHTPDDNTVYVEGGVYNENVTIANFNNLTLRGSADGILTTLAGSVSIINSTNITLTNLMFTQAIVLTNSDDLTIIGTDQNDNITLIGSGVSGAVTVNGGMGDDTLTLDNSLGVVVPLSGLSYDGGDGFDVLVLSGGAFQQVNSTPSSASAGVIDLDGRLVTYANIEPIIDTTVADQAIYSGTDLGETLTISDGPTINGLATLLISGNTIESVTFANKKKVLVDAKSGLDDVNVSFSRPATGLGELTINKNQENKLNFSGPSQATVTFKVNVYLAGASLIVFGRNIIVNSGVTVSTRKVDQNDHSIGNSGNIEFEAKYITINPGAKLLAGVESGSNYLGGNIKFEAIDAVWTGVPAIDWIMEQVIAPWFGVEGFSMNRAKVTIDGAVLQAKEVVIKAEAKFAQNPELGKKFFDQYPIVELLKNAAAAIFGSDFSLPVDIYVGLASAQVLIKGDSEIESEGALLIDSTAEVEVENEVFTEFFNIAFGYANTQATVSIADTTKLKAGGNILITSNAKPSIQNVGRTTTDAGEHKGSLSIAVSITDLTSHVTIGQGVIITSDANVNIQALATNVAVAKADFKIWKKVENGKTTDAKAGLTVAFSFASSDVLAQVDGTIIATGNSDVSKGIKNDPSVFAKLQGLVPLCSLLCSIQTTDVISVANHGFETGEVVIYRSGGGTSIGGLEDGAEYYIIRVDADHFKLAKIPPLEIDNSLVRQNAQQSLALVVTKDFNLSGVGAPIANTISLAGHGFTNGKKLTYFAGTDGAIDGLTSGDDYYVVNATANTFQLSGTPDGLPIDIQVTSDCTKTSHTFIYADTPNVFDASIAVSNIKRTITILNHGFKTGDIVEYATDPNAPSVSQQQNAVFNPIATFSPTSDNLVDYAGSRILLMGHGLSDGEAVVYHVNGGTAIGGLTDGATYFVKKIDADYIQLAPALNGASINLQSGATGTKHSLSYTRVISGEDTPLRGLDNGERYYVIVLDKDTVMLADSEEGASDAMPIMLDLGKATGDKHSLDLGSTAGIGIKAQLSTKEIASAVAGIGGLPTLRDRIVRKEMQTAWISAQTKSLRESVLKKLGVISKAKDAMDQATGGSNSFSLAGALAFTWSDHKVLAQIGSTAVLKSGIDIVVSATQKDQYQSMAEGTDAQDNANSNSTTVGVALIVAIYQNNVQAHVADNASLDAKRNLTLKAEVTYPFLTKPTAQELFGKKWGEQPLKNLTDLFNKNLGLQAKLFNSWARSVAAGGGTETGIAVSVDFIYLDSVANASIGASAKINQDAAYQTSNQKVKATAYTQAQFINLAGIFDLNITEQGFYDKMYKKKDPYGVFNPMAAKGKKGGWGGALTIQILNFDTEATIGNNAKIHTGINGSLIVTATTSLTNFALTQSGANAATAVAGSFSFIFIDNKTLAQIGGGAQITGGSINLNASDDTLDINIAGGIVKGENQGIGVTVSVNDITRDTEATIGNANANATLNITGDVKVNAESSGSLYAFSLAAAIVKGAPPNNIDKDLSTVTDTELLRQQFISNSKTFDGKNSTALKRMPPIQSKQSAGISFAGDVSIDLVTETTRAYIYTSSAVNATGTVTVTASNDSDFVTAAGAAALTFGIPKGKKSNGIAGSVSWNDLSMTTEAYIRNATVNARNLIVQAKNTGMMVAVTGSADVATSQSSFQVALSLSFNNIDATSRAYLDTANLTLTGDLSITATNSSKMIAIGGGVSIGLQASVGVGAAVGVNFITDTTTAETRGNSIFKVSGAITLGADNSSTIYGVGISVGAGKSAFAVTIGLNLIDNSTTATLLNVNGASSVGMDAVTVKATNASKIYSFAGGLGIGLKSMGFGAAFAWNQMDNTVRARIEGCALPASSLTVLANMKEAEIWTLSAGAAGGKETAIAGSVSVNIINNTVDAHISKNSDIDAAGTVIVAASDNSAIWSLAGQISIAIGNDSKSFGAAVGYNEIDNTVTAYIDNSSVTTTSSGNVSITANEDATIYSISAGAEGAQSFALGGSVSVNFLTLSTTAYFSGTLPLYADGSVLISAFNRPGTWTLAGELTVAIKPGGSSAAIGLACATLDASITTEAYIGHDAVVNVKGNGNGLAVYTGEMKNDKPVTQTVNGLAVVAVSFSDYDTFAVAGSISGSSGGNGAGIAGSASVDLLDENVRAFVGANAKINNPNSGAASNQSVVVRAANNLNLFGLGGGLAVGASTSSNAGGVAAGVDVAVVNKLTRAFIDVGANVIANSNVIVEAIASESVSSISASMAVAVSAKMSAGLSGSVGVSVYDLTTEAFISGTVNTNAPTTVLANGSVVVSARDSTDIDVIAGSAAVSVGKNAAAVAGAIGIPIISKTTRAYIGKGAVVDGLGNYQQGVSVYTGNISEVLIPDTMNVINDPQMGKTPTVSNTTNVNNNTDYSTVRRTTPDSVANFKGVAVSAVNQDSFGTWCIGAGVAVALDPTKGVAISIPFSLSINLDFGKIQGGKRVIGKS